MEKIAPRKVRWNDALESKFIAAGFTAEIIEELKTLGEVWQVEELTIITRIEPLNRREFEVVWMASLGAGVARWADTFLIGAKRAGAKYIRFHIADDEKAILRFWRKWKPEAVKDSGFDSGAYRVALGVVDE